MDTIAAIATGSGAAGVGIIRLSGPDSLAIADHLTRGSSSSARQASHTLRYVTVRDPKTSEAIDDGLRAVFRAPRSFTGEDVVELQLHGGPVILSRALAAALTAGARPARPGEFSERAFLNGKLDLAQAEAVADLISAGTVAAQRAARRQLSGELSEAVRAIKGDIAEALAQVEASIDYPEEVGEIDPPRVDIPLSLAEDRITALLATAGYGKRLRDGMTVVLTGRPNVGKSSLLNALSGTERAIVTPIPGTTRDIVEEALNLGGIPVRALDTAGLRETEDAVERIGVARAERAAAEADVVIVVLDATSGLTDADRSLLDRLSSGPPVVVAVNKSDFADALPLLHEIGERFPTLTAVPTSAPTRTGLTELAEAVAHAVRGAVPNTDTPLVTAARHEAALRAAAAAVSRARATLAAYLPAELIAVDAHGAIAALGEITGETTREDIIAEVFSRFCLGK